MSLDPNLIAVDIDEVLSQYVKTFLTWHNSVYKTTFTLKDITHHDLSCVLGCSLEQFIEKLHVFHETSYFKELPTLPGALRGTEWLRKEYTLIAVTARSDYLQAQTQSWLDTNFPGTFSAVYYTPDFDVAPVLSKADICDKEGAAVMIEDSYNNAVACATNGRKVLLFDKPWNRHHPSHPSVQRVYSWPDILRHL